VADYCSVALRGLPEAVRAVTVGSNLRIYVWATDEDGLALDPDNVTLRVLSPAEDATEQVWTLDGAGASDPLTAGATAGNWHADTVLDAAGVWLVRAEVSGSHADADERRFTVPASAFA
jgi:hypothetical protein